MPSNCLENLRFTLILENLLNNSVNPTITVGLNGNKSHNFLIDKTHNKLIFDEKIYESGKNTLTVCVNELNQDSYKLNSFIIRDLRINGISVSRLIYQCVYYPYYDKEYAESVPNLPESISGGLHIGNRGKWHWFFDAPVTENPSMKFGLW